jgi:hypothetical protein
MHKNLNAFHRIEGVPTHSSLHGFPKKELTYAEIQSFEPYVLIESLSLKANCLVD